MNYKKLIFSILIPVVLGSLIGVLIDTSSYGYLLKPALSPPSWLFPVMWTVLYILMQRISFLLVSYFIYKSFGLDSFSIFLIIAFQVCIVMAGEFIPTPGGVMVYEGIILSINELLYGKGLALSSMLLQRSINFYLLMLVSFIFYLVFHYDKKRRKRKEKILNEKKYS